MTSGFTALYDACVLFPAALRDLLLELAGTGLFRARWTDAIHEEWMGAVLRQRPDLQRTQLERTRGLMDNTVLDCLVTGYESLIEGLALPDPDDRHVLAAAITAGAQVIVTFNGKDFPPDALAPFGVEAQHPDEFVTDLIDLSPGLVAKSLQRQRARLKNPPLTSAQLLDHLAGLGLTETAARMAEFEPLI